MKTHTAVVQVLTRYSVVLKVDVVENVKVVHSMMVFERSLVIVTGYEDRTTSSCVVVY